MHSLIQTQNESIDNKLELSKSYLQNNNFDMFLMLMLKQTKFYLSNTWMTCQFTFILIRRPCYYKVRIDPIVNEQEDLI